VSTLLHLLCLEEGSAWSVTKTDVKLYTIIFTLHPGAQSVKWLAVGQDNWGLISNWQRFFFYYHI
jgi:hypothetical protein